MQLIYYNANQLAQYQELPGVKNFLPYFAVYGAGVAPVDRSSTLTFPVHMKSLFPLPQMRVFEPNYEDVCNERAQDLLARAQQLDCLLYVFWSGGVDSTCVLVSLLKVASREQKQRIVVLMSEQSIVEYPAFYAKYVRGKLNREPAMLFPYLFGTPNLLVNGECNDQLFGSDAIAGAMRRLGADAVLGRYDRPTFKSFIAAKIDGDENAAETLVKIFEQLKEKACIELRSIFDLLWWINFTLKWQTVYMRMLALVAQRNVHLLTPIYVKTYYQPFYNTEEFQLWSMNNREQRIRDNSWRSYKWQAKEVIYDFTKDADYRDSKLKRGSLQFLSHKHVRANYIDDEFKFYETSTPEQFYEPNNSFV